MGVIYFIVTVVAGLCLYRLRCLRPRWYGMGEIAVGVAMIYLWYWPPVSFLITEEANPWGLALSRNVSLVLGAYLLVRGMDNIDRDLPRGWRPRWDRLFPKHRA
jgi:hypothetical protein